MDDFRDFDDVEFEIARRGYDRDQVDAHLAQVRAEIARLQNLIRGAGESEDGSYPEPVQAELDRVSVEVDAIIGAAREAAEGLRTRAASEASRWRDEADADARRWRSEAEEESTRMRREAETASQRALEEAQEEADRRRADADSYAARIREEADAYAQQTRQAAESAASQLKEEADAYAAGARESADQDAAEVRQDADTYAGRVTSNADEYAVQTRQAADGYAEETRQAADGYAQETRQAADDDAAETRREADAYAVEVRTAADEAAQRTTDEAESVAAEARQAAQRYAAALRESADTETARQRADAKEAADTARASVWEQSTAILENVAREVAEVREQAETDALAIIADGERQSHRLVSQARQTSEEQRRSARMEAERLVGDAQTQHDEIIETANRAAAAAQERAQALERRREELMGQLEKTQDAMRTLEEELETKRGLRDRDLPADTSTVKIVSPPEPEELAGVRVIPSMSRETPAPVSAEEIMDEVISLRQQRQEEDLSGPAADAPDVQDTPEPEPEPAGDIDSLFANLRQADPPRQPGRQKAAPRPDPAVDPDELRERLLLPLQNRAHREVKRHLTDQQNVALEQLRVSGADWQPDPGQHHEAFGPPIGELLNESARAGYLAARELGVRSDEPPAGTDVDDRSGEEFVTDLVAAVGDALDASRAAGETVRKTSGAVSRVYRAWRTDRAEHRLREMSDVAYADALRVALRSEGIEDTEWALGDWGTARHAS